MGACAKQLKITTFNPILTNMDLTPTTEEGKTHQPANHINHPASNNKLTRNFHEKTA